MTMGVRWSGRQRRLWLAVAAVVAAGVVAALASLPPALADADAGGRAFAALAAASIVALSILPFIVWRGEVRPTTWVVAAAATLLLGRRGTPAPDTCNGRVRATTTTSRSSSARR